MTPRDHSSETRTLLEFQEVSKNKIHQIISSRLFLCFTCIHTQTSCNTTGVKTERFSEAEIRQQLLHSMYNVLICMGFLFNRHGTKEEKILSYTAPSFLFSQVRPKLTPRHWLLRVWMHWEEFPFAVCCGIVY